jgi:glutamate/aspartate transport system permease protein
MNYKWDWGIFLAAEPGGTGTYLTYLVVGLGWTLATALAAWAIALAIGSVVGTLRTTPYKWVVRLGNAYVEIFRNVPLIVQMFLWFFVARNCCRKAWATGSSRCRRPGAPIFPPSCASACIPRCVSPSR